MYDQRINRESGTVNGRDHTLQRRNEAKARVASSKRMLQDAQDQLVIAKATAESDVDPVFVQAQEAWRMASSEYSNALNEYTRLLGPKLWFPTH